MPHITGPVILRAWRHKTEEGVIHFIARTALTGRLRHCLVKQGDPLYSVLDSHLRAQGYIAPQSATDSVR